MLIRCIFPVVVFFVARSDALGAGVFAVCLAAAEVALIPGGREKEGVHRYGRIKVLGVVLQVGFGKAQKFQTRMRDLLQIETGSVYWFSSNGDPTMKTLRNTIARRRCLEKRSMPSG